MPPPSPPSIPHRRIAIVRLTAAASLVALAIWLTGCEAGAGKIAKASAPSSTTTTTSADPSTTTPGTGTSAETSTSTSTLPGTGKPAITIGDKNYTEQFVLGELYAQALQADGFTVELNRNIGPTDVTIQALQSGRLAMYPEYLDTWDSAVAGLRRSFRTEVGAYAAALRYASAHSLSLLDPTPFSSTFAIGVTVGYASQNRLRSLRDLRRVAQSLNLGGPPQLQQSAGLPAVEQAYGFTPATFTQLGLGDQYIALNAGTVQAAYVGTTDGELASGDYDLLRDPRRVFGFGNVVPVVSTKVLAAEGQAFSEVINGVSAALSIGAIRQMNAAVDIAQLDPATVAKQFLETHGLIPPSP
jgi:osmoprotectant transport system substrate-binding protein